MDYGGRAHWPTISRSLVPPQRALVKNEHSTQQLAIGLNVKSFAGMALASQKMTMDDRLVETI